MYSYIRFIVNWPKIALLVFISITFFLLVGIPKVEFDNSIDSFMPEKDPEYQYYKKIKSIYGSNDNFYIMSVSRNSLWNRFTFETLENFLIDIEAYKSYDYEKEQIRINYFDRIILKEVISIADFLEYFSLDPAFQRLVLRKIRNNLGEVSFLDKDNIKSIRKKVIESHNLKKQEPVSQIISPFTTQDIIGEEDTLLTYDIIEKNEFGERIIPSSSKDFEQIKKKLIRNPSFKNLIYTTNINGDEITDFGFILKFNRTIPDNDPITREIDEIVEMYDDLLDITCYGAPYVNMVFNNYVKRDLYTFLPLVMFVVICIFYYNFRSVKGIILPFLSLSAADIWVIGLMGHLGYPITSVGSSLPSLMIAIGSSYSIHILNQYYHDANLISRKGTIKGLSISMAHISTTVLLAGMTTFLAFLTLSYSEIRAIKEWSVFAAFGVLSSIIISLTVIPAGLSLIKNSTDFIQPIKEKLKRKTLIDYLISVLTSLSINHNKAVLLVALILILVSVSGVFMLNVETQFLLNFKENDPVRVNNRIIEKKLSGGTGFQIVLNTEKPNGVLKTNFLNYVEALREWLVIDNNKDLSIGRTDAFCDFIKTMHMAMNNEDKAYYSIPKNDLEILDYIELYSGNDNNDDGLADDFESFVDSDFKQTIIHVRFCSRTGEILGTSLMKKIIETVSTHIDETIPRGCTFNITGHQLMIIKFLDFVVNGQIYSLIFSLTIIGLIVFILFNNIKAGLLALIPMTSAVICSFGVMGWSGIDLDIITSIIAAVTIGIGVDDTIHFLNTYRYYISRSPENDIDKTIEQTLAVSGKAILFTSFALIFGFGALMLSNFKPLILFGFLMAVTMSATTVGALLILPATIKTFRIDLSISSEKKGLNRYFNWARIFGLE